MTTLSLNKKNLNSQEHSQEHNHAKKTEDEKQNIID